MKRRYSQTEPEPSFAFGRNTRINGGTFNNIQRDNYQLNNPHFDQFNVVQNRCESGLDALRQSIITGAIHDSAERYPPGKCHPGTREKVIKTIVDWINNPNASEDVFWLHGSAGAGKSAIMQTIAELLKQQFLNQYGGSFFFSRDIPGRNSANNLFSTLAYQIAMNIPGMRTIINDAMNNDRTLPHKSMDIQLQSLMVDTIAHISHLPHPPTVIIDGLDECHDSQTQRKILSLISEAIAVSRVPLRFLIASRPEFWIGESFNEQPLLSVTTRLSLSQSADTDLDIEKYLRQDFDKIYAANRDIMAGVALPWPSDKLIGDLVERASGQFIYAATVLKFVGGSSDFNNPDEQLKIISSPGPLQGSPFSDLDQLYTTILSRYPRRDSLLSVLGALLVWHYIDEVDITSCITLTVEPSEMKMVLRSIASVIVVRDIKFDSGDEDINQLYSTTMRQCRFSHLSLREYLEDSNRSGPFFINEQDLRDSLCSKFFDIIHNGLKVEGVKPPPHMSQLAYQRIWAEFCGNPSLHVTPTRLQQCVERLRVQFLEFRTEGYLILIHPESLLRYLEYAECLILGTQGRRYAGNLMEQSLVDAALVDIRTLQDMALRQLFSANGREFLKILSYYMAEYNPNFLFISTDFRSLYYLLGSRVSAKMVLTKHSHLLEVLYEPMNHGRVTYQPLGCLLRFLCNPDRGGSLHTEFRTCCIATCTNLVLRLLPAIEGHSTRHYEVGVNRREMVVLLYNIIQVFFDTHTLSDVNGEKDVDTMEDLAIVLKTYDWKKLKYEVGNWSGTRIQNRTENLLTVPGQHSTSQKMQQAMAKIYHDCWSPWIQDPYFSEILIMRHHSESDASFKLLRSIRETEFQEYAPDLIKADLNDYWEIPSSPSINIFRLMSTMDRVFDEVKYEIQISPSHWFTLAAELYLNILAKHLYQRVHQDLHLHRPPINREFKFDICLLHTHPSDKIIIALRAIFYLCSKLVAETWRAPYNFSLFTLGLLKKYNLDVQEMSEFTSWLELLKSNEVDYTYYSDSDCTSSTTSSVDVTCDIVEVGCDP